MVIQYYNYIVKFSKVATLVLIYSYSECDSIYKSMFVQFGNVSYSEGVPTPSMMETKPVPVSEKVSVAQIE